MKIAIPLFGDRISPHFGSSAEILLVETHDGRIDHQHVVQAGSNDPGKIARFLFSCGVNRVVCGGMQRNHKRWLLDKGIEVMDNQKGKAADVLSAIIGPGADSSSGRGNVKGMFSR